MADATNTPAASAVPVLDGKVVLGHLTLVSQADPAFVNALDAVLSSGEPLPAPYDKFVDGAQDHLGASLKLFTSGEAFVAAVNKVISDRLKELAAPQQAPPAKK